MNFAGKMRESQQEASESEPKSDPGDPGVSSDLSLPTSSSGFTSKGSKYDQINHLWTDDETKKIMTGQSAVE